MHYSGVSYTLGLLVYFFTIFLSLWYQVSSYLTVCILRSILLTSSSFDLPHFFSFPKFWSFTFHCIEYDHITTYIPFTDIGLEILNWEGYLVSESLHHCLRVYPYHYVFSLELICLYLEHVQLQQKKTEKKGKIIINGWACMCVCERQMTFSLGLWIIISFIISSIGNLIILNVLIRLDRCSFAFLFIHFFSHFISFTLSSSFFVHIHPHLMFDIFFIITITPLIAIRFFFHSFITNIILLFLSSPLIYSHWTSFDPWLMRFSTHIAFCTWGYGFDHWVFEPSFLSFLHPITLVYVTSHVLRPPWGHVIMHYVW